MLTEFTILGVSVIPAVDWSIAMIPIIGVALFVGKGNWQRIGLSLQIFWQRLKAFFSFRRKNASVDDLQSVAQRTQKAKGTASAVASQIPAVQSTNGSGKQPKKKPTKDTSIQDFRVHFLRTVTQLRSRTGKPDSVYDYPWYLLLGSEESGKTTLLHNSSLQRWVYDEGKDGSGKTGDQLCRWWSSKNAIVLDVSGSFVAAESGQTNDSGWKLLMRLLQQQRYRRPIDGAVLTIPCSDLIGATRLTSEEIAKKGAQLHAKMRDIEKQLGMCIPVYLIITKCDFISGFAEFVDQLPEAHRSEIFGWSNPYTLETAYTSEWIAEGFHTMSDTLNPVQFEMLAELPNGTDGDGLFKFPAEFRCLLDGVQAYSDAIFRPGTHTRTALMLRGVYFTGEESGPADFDMNGSNGDGGMTVTLPPDPGVQPGFMQPGFMQPDPYGVGVKVRENGGNVTGNDSPKLAINPAISYGGMPIAVDAAAIITPSARNRHVVFVRDLFERKVLSESTIAYPFAGNVLSKNRLILLLQILLGMVVAVGVIGTPIEYARLKGESLGISEALRGIDNTLTEIEIRKPALTDEDYVRYADETLARIAIVENESLSSVIFPWSLISPVHGDIRSSVVIAFNKVIVPAMKAQLNYKADSLLKANRANASVDTTDTQLSFENTKEFEGLRDYITSLSKLQHNAVIYNGLRDVSDSASLNSLVYYLFDRDLPREIRNNPGSIRSVLAELNYDDFKFESYREDATNIARNLFGNLNERLFTYNPLLTRVHTIINEITTLADSRGTDVQSVNRLFAVKSGITEAKEAIRQGKFNWLLNDELKFDQKRNEKSAHDPFRSVAVLLDAVDTSRFIDVSIRHMFTSEAQKRFFQLRKDIFQEKSTILEEQIIGISGANRDSIVFMPKVDSLHAAIAQLENQRFTTRKEGSITGKEQLLYWNAEALNNGLKLVDMYREFADGVTPSLPQSLQDAISGVGLTMTEWKLASIINEAQHAQGTSSMAASLTSAEPHLTNLLKFYDENNLPSADLLRKVLQRQINTSLIGLTKQLDGQKVFDLAAQDPGIPWDGATPLGVLYFGDAAAMKAQIDEWKATLQQYATDYAQPLIRFLSTVGTAGGGIDREIKSWREISGGASLAALEMFFVSLNDVTLDNYDDKLPDLGKLSAPTYLREKLYNAVKHVREKCDGLLIARIDREYEALIPNLYQPDIANRAPQRWSGDRSRNKDDNLGNIRTFFEKFSGFKNRYHNAWKGLHREKQDFIREIDVAAPFYEAVFAGDQDKTPGVELLVEFKEYDQASDGRSSNFVSFRTIADWTLRIGDQVISLNQFQRNNRQPLKIRWNVEDDIVFSLRWPKGGDSYPIGIKFDKPQNASTYTPDPDKSRGLDSSYTIRYQRPWSLVQMLLGVPVDQRMQHGYNFEVVTNKGETVKLRLGISIIGAASNYVAVKPLP